MASVQIDVQQFHSRASSLSSSFKDNPSLFGDADVLVIALGASDEDNPYQKAPALQTWLLGYEFTDTVFSVLRDGSMIILTSSKKASYIEPILKGPIHITILHRTKENSKLLELFELYKRSGSGKKLGMFARDKMSGKFATEWSSVLESSGFEVVDASYGCSILLSQKDRSEHDLVSTASKISAAIMKNFLFEEIMAIVDDEKSITHEQLAIQIDSILHQNTQALAKQLKFPSNADLGMLEWCYFPVIQSGGVYDLRPSAASDTNQLHAGTIVCALGVRYKSYCSNLGRTLLINPSKQMELNYEFLLELRGFILTELHPGMKCKDVYNRAVGYVKQKRPDLEQYLVKSLGFGIGIEFRELMYTLTSKTDSEILPNSIFNLSVGFQNLTNDAASSSDPRSQVYALQISDTVLISPDKTTTLTQGCTWDASEICLFFEDDNQVPSKPEKQERSNAASSSSKKKPSSAAASNLDYPSRTILKEKTRKQASLDVSVVLKRKEHQKELARIKQQDGLRRFAHSEIDTTKSDKPVFKKFESYKNWAMIPKEASQTIMLDARNMTLLLPVYGLIVPLHINTLKNVTKSDEGEFSYLRFNLVTPGQSIGKKEESVFENPNATFVKTLSYRSADTYRLTEVYRQILELKKTATKEEAERKDKADIIEQDRLIEAVKFKPIALYDVYARPTLDGKRLPGDLEIHTNGLRYRSRIKSENRIDLLFNNVQHMFFQPCDHELIVILHIHLKNPIMVGKKKTRDIQFYKEVSDASFDETGNRSRRRQAYGDEDELQAEQDEKRRRVKLNREFKEYADKVVENEEVKFIVDIPFRELGFTGVPHRANVLLQPTQDCLVHLTDPPFTVIPLVDVETVHLERIQFGLKNFDLVFVFTDYQRVPVHVNSIPASELELVREWLDTNDVLFSEGPVNLNWGAIMKTINEDPAAFYEETGWSFLQAGSDDEDGFSSESASEFEASDVEEEEVSTEYSSEAAGDSDDDSVESEESDMSVIGSDDDSEDDARAPQKRAYDDRPSGKSAGGAHRNGGGSFKKVRR